VTEPDAGRVKSGSRTSIKNFLLSLPSGGICEGPDDGPHQRSAVAGLPGKDLLVDGRAGADPSLAGPGERDVGVVDLGEAE